MNKIKATGFVTIAVIALISITAAMPMSSVTPEQAAEIMVQPLRDTATGYHNDLVNGDITEDEYITLMYLHVQVIKLKGVLLDVLMACELTANELRAGLCEILPWRVRALGNIPRIIGGAHL